MGVSEIWGKWWGEKARKNLSVLRLWRRRSTAWNLVCGNIYTDTFKTDTELSTRRQPRGVLPHFKQFLNRQCMCKRGFGSAAYSRNGNGFATQQNSHRAESKLEDRNQIWGQKIKGPLCLAGRREREAQPGAWKCHQSAHARNGWLCWGNSPSCEPTCRLCERINKSSPRQFNRLTPAASSFSSFKRNNPSHWFQPANHLAYSPRGARLSSPERQEVKSSPRLIPTV